MILSASTGPDIVAITTTINNKDVNLFIKSLLCFSSQLYPSIILVYKVYLSKVLQQDYNMVTTGEVGINTYLGQANHSLACPCWRKKRRPSVKQRTVFYNIYLVYLASPK